MKKRKGEVSPESSGVGRNAVGAQLYPKGAIAPAVTLGLLELGGGLQDMKNSTRIPLGTGVCREPEKR